MPIYTSIVSLLIALYYVWIGIFVVQIRTKTKIAAPAVSGHPELERVLRAQINAVEFAPVIFPSLWLAALWLNDGAAAGLGVVWIIARIAYAFSYVQAPDKRGPAFIIQTLVAMILVLMAFTGIGMKLLHF